VSPGGAFATAALILWVLITVVLFFTMKPERAALIAIFGGLLFLPEKVTLKVPLLPEFTKQTIPYFAAILGFTLRQSKRVWRLPRERWLLVVTVVMLVAGIGVGKTNPDGLSYGVWRKIFIPGLSIKDGMYVAMHMIFSVGIPFFMGTVLIREVSDIEYLLRFLVKIALVYSLFALLEVRLSPQLHLWVYGFAQHSFGQTMRFGGYRPMVFMEHGLAVGLFFAVALLSATVLTIARTKRIFAMTPKAVVIYLAVVLILCKSTGAIIYATAGMLMLFLSSASMQRRIALALAMVVLLYPSLRGSGAFPTEGVLSLAKSIGEERHQSLEFRFTNEDTLLKKARERPVFGWGTYGRNLVYDDIGKVAAVTDGEWIIALGVSGFVGFFAKFSLLVIPIFLAARRLRKVPRDPESRMVAGLTLIVTITAVDLLPNGLFSNYPFFLAGALSSGSALLLTRDQEEDEYEDPEPAPA
jgi:hypothetical protein